MVIFSNFKKSDTKPSSDEYPETGKTLIFGFCIISKRLIFCLSDFYNIPDIQYMQISDRLAHYVNHFCLLEQIISWLPLAELGAETIWFPCVYFSLASVKVVQSDFIGRHRRHAGLKSPISESICLSVHRCALDHRIQTDT